MVTNEPNINFIRNKSSVGSPRKKFSTTLDKIPDELEEEPSIDNSARPLLVNIELSTHRDASRMATPTALLQ